MPKIIVGYLVALIIISAYIAISSLFIVFPGSVIDDFPIHRPYEIPGLALFSGSFDLLFIKSTL